MVIMICVYVFMCVYVCAYDDQRTTSGVPPQGPKGLSLTSQAVFWVIHLCRLQNSSVGGTPT